MATYTVYSPCTGLIAGLNCYCNRRVAVCGSGGTDCQDTTSLKCKDQTTENCNTCGACGCQSCCQHKLAGPTGFSLPLDVGAATGLIKFWGSSNVLSIKTIFRNECCSAAASCGNDVDNGVKCGVEAQLFKQANAGGTSIGSILYCHVRFRNNYLTDGGVYNYSAFGTGGPIWGKSIGQAPAMPATYRTCYGSIHSHMQVKGTGVARTGSGCAASMTAGSSMVYTWTQ